MAINVTNKILTTSCPHKNKHIVYDPLMRKIQKCYDCGEETILEEPAPKSQPSNSGAYSSINSGTYAIGYNSHAYGYSSLTATTGHYNIAIGSNAGRSIPDKGFVYAADYSENYNTNNDMRISEALMGDLEKYREQLRKDNTTQHSKLDKLKEKVERYKEDIINSSNVKIAALDSIRQSPAARSEYGENTRLGYYREEVPQKSLTEYTDIEYVQFLIRNTTFEEKTYEDVKYIDFIFHLPMSQDNDLLNILDSGDVLEWRKIPKNPKLGILSPKVKAIKSIRISVEDLKNSRKEHNIGN